MTEVLSGAIQSVLTPRVLMVVAASAVYGIFVGAIPGLTATMAVALLVPLTFFLEPTEAVAAIVTTVTCSIFAGDIPATLVRIPGTPASAAYANDAYALTRQGRHEQSLLVSLIFSVSGGLLGTMVLAFAAPTLASVAKQFTSYENFWLYFLGLTCAAVVSDQSPLRGGLALCIGLLLSTIGLGPDFAKPRLTFGFDELATGINFIPAMIGLFGMSEVLRNALRVKNSPEAENESTSGVDKLNWPPLRSTLGEVTRLLTRRVVPLFRSSAIGAIVGMLPGAGADIAAWISYAVSKRSSSQPETYGRGSLEGLGDATGANNAALGGAWIPALVFGIPGDSVTAIAIGVLLMKNVTPGPNIFDPVQNPEQTALVYGIFVTFVLTNLLLIPLGVVAIRTSRLLLAVPRRVLLPVVVAFCTVGAYAMNASYFDVGVMLVMGVLGFVLETQRVPLGPVVLGIILGGPLEHKFVQSVTKSDRWTDFLASPICIALAIACLAMWLAPWFMRRRRSNPASVGS